MSFETFFADDDAYVPEIHAYAADPTIANARALLAALRIPEPYERLRASKRRRGESPSAPSARRGGARRIAAELAPDAIVVHERADALHDAYGPIVRTSRLLIARILSADAATAPAFAKFPGLAKSLRDITLERKEPPTFTYNVVAALNAAFGLTFRDDGLGTLRSDRRLHAQVTEWRSREATEIVLDGIVSSPSNATILDTLSEDRIVRIARSQALCAFVMLLLADYDPSLAEPYAFEVKGTPAFAVPSGTAAPSVLYFLSGPFQTMDVPGWNAYMRKWTGAIRAAAPRLWKRIGFRDIALPLRSASGAEIRANSVRLPNGSVVSFHAPKDAVRPDDAAAAGCSRAEAVAQNFAVSAPKTWFQSLFEEYKSASKAERSAMERLIDNAIAMNALRDAIKADIALARGAAFVTYDRLALLYYELRRAALGAAGGDAAGVWIFARGIGEAKLGAYE